jgi:hypothetical protein
MTKSKKNQVDRLLSDYGDAIDKMFNEIKSGATILPRLPDDMTENSSAETAFRVAVDQAGETNDVHIRARRIRNDVLNSGKRSFNLSAGDQFATIAIVYYTEKFQSNFGAIEGGDINENTVIGAIEAAFAIGTLAPPDKGLQRRLKRVAELSRTEGMRAIKREIDDKRAAKLSEAIRAEAAQQRRALAISREYADLIRPGVRRRLNLDPEGEDWPSVATIKNTISEIKKAKT